MGSVDLLLSLVVHTYQQLGIGPIDSIDWTKITREQDDKVDKALYYDSGNGLTILAEREKETTSLRVARWVGGTARMNLVNVSLRDDAVDVYKYVRQGADLATERETHTASASFQRTQECGTLPKQTDVYLHPVDPDDPTTRNHLSFRRAEVIVVTQRELRGTVVNKTRKVFPPAQIHPTSAEILEHSVPRAPGNLAARSTQGITHLMTELAIRAANFLRGPWIELRDWDASFFKVGMIALFVSTSIYLGSQITSKKVEA
ncbi:MAG: hypothetical protein HYT76_02315 [Deltaproteobacteria bacterium]|nr:hypothetical protein [Deltaproteobacteria bacterium]